MSSQICRSASRAARSLLSASKSSNLLAGEFAVLLIFSLLLAVYVLIYVIIGVRLDDGKFVGKCAGRKSEENKSYVYTVFVTSFSYFISPFSLLYII